MIIIPQATIGKGKYNPKHNYLIRKGPGGKWFVVDITNNAYIVGNMDTKQEAAYYFDQLIKRKHGIFASGLGGR